MKRFSLTLLSLFIPLLLFAQSSSRVDSLRAQLNLNIQDSLKILTEIELSRALHSKGQHEQDLVHAIAAVQQAEILNDTLSYARALDNLGLIYRFHQHYAKALPLHIKAYELIEEKEVLPYYKMRFANNSAVAARYDLSYDQAVSYFIAALKIAEVNDDLRNIAISSNGLGNTFINIPEKQDVALEYFLKALEAEQEQQNDRGIAINYLSISDYFIQKGQFDTARVYLDKLHNINEQMNDQFGLGMTYEFYGHNYLKEGLDLNKAKSYYTQSLEIFRALNNNNKQADVLFSLGDLFLLEGMLDKAEDHYQQSFGIAQRLNNKDLIMENALQLSRIYEQTSVLDKALSFYKISQVYEDSINMIEQETKIAGIKLAYDFEKKEGEIALLKKDKDIQEAALYIQSESLKKQKAVVIFILGGFVVVILFFLLIYRNLNLKKNIKLSLKEQEKKRLQIEYENNLLQAEILASRMQMNPHFLFNCLNSIKYLIQTEKYKEAINYLTVFSRFVRSVLEMGKKKDISLTEELDLIRRYVQLEENRFDQNFIFKIRYIGLKSERMGAIFIPPMLLQPFVENAIWHGLLSSKKEKKILDLRITKVNDDILIVIEDNGVGRKNIKLGPTVDLHKSMGTRITQDRIDLFNKNSEYRISFEIIDVVDELNDSVGTKVVIRLSSIMKEEISYEK